MIQNLNDLQKLLKLLRKQGVVDFKMGEIELKLGDLPFDKTVSQSQEETDADNPYAGFPEGVLTPEQLMFYSSGGHPDDDPENKQ